MLGKAARRLRAGPLAAAASRWRVCDGRGMAAACRGLQGHPCRWQWLDRKRGRLLLHQRRSATSGALATAMLGGAVIGAGLLRCRRCIACRVGVVVCVFVRDARRVFCRRGDRCDRRVCCLAAAAPRRSNTLHRQTKGQQQGDQQPKQQTHWNNVALVGCLRLSPGVSVVRVSCTPRFFRRPNWPCRRQCIKLRGTPF